METIKLKDRIINRILAIDDLDFLKAMDLLTKDKSKKSVYFLSAEQKERINLARKEMDEGSVIEHDALNEKVNTWLNTK